MSDARTPMGLVGPGDGHGGAGAAEGTPPPGEGDAERQRGAARGERAQAQGCRAPDGSLDPIEAQRRAAGEAAAASVEDGMVIGYGTGRAAAAALEALAVRVRRGLRVAGVPTSQRTAELCAKLGLTVTSLEEHPALDLVIDGADEIDPERQALKGGGGALVREKLVALAARRRIFVVEEAKLVPRLGATRGLPIDVLAFGWRTTLARVRALLPGTAVREGPEGPLRSDNGGFLLDAPIPESADLRALGAQLKGLPGVLDHGLFLDMSPEVIIGGAGGVRKL